MARKCLIAFLCLLLIAKSCVHLGAICKNIPGLGNKQVEICNTRPDAMVAIGQGAEKALQECQWQFSNKRWNCSMDENTSSLQLGERLPVGSREAGYAYSIKSAGITYAITQGCSAGQLSGCGCDDKKESQQNDQWKWGGCSADVSYGAEFARIFVDASESNRMPRSLMNLHNNRVGRKLIKEMVVTDCKCHGPSGSCGLKTCWMKLPSFREVGSELMKRYHKAKKVEPVQLQKKKRKKSYTLLRSKRSQDKKKPRKSDLVFLDESPNYCEFNKTLGSLGTKGRHCNKTSQGSDGCNMMCCGRGYNTHEYTRKWQCDCKFHWCCHVTCKDCQEKTEIYSCK